MVKSSAKQPHPARSASQKKLPKNKITKTAAPSRPARRQPEKTATARVSTENGKPKPPLSAASAIKSALAVVTLPSPALPGGSAPANGHGNGNGAAPREGGFDIAEKVKELVRLAKEQGYLTYNDINDALPDNVVNPDDLDEIYTQLHNLDVEIVDQAEVDVVKQPEAEEDEVKEDAKMRLDILDDPVRMYLKQMGQVPLLTREQEVEICKRIEEAENQVKAIIYSFGFTGKEHGALAEKLISEPPKERFDRVIVDKKVDSRDAHLKELRRLLKAVHRVDEEVDEKYANWLAAHSNAEKQKRWTEFTKADQKLQRTFPKFYYTALAGRWLYLDLP